MMENKLGEDIDSLIDELDPKDVQVISQSELLKGRHIDRQVLQLLEDFKFGEKGGRVGTPVVKQNQPQLKIEDDDWDEKPTKKEIPVTANKEKDNVAGKDAAVESAPAKAEKVGQPEKKADAVAPKSDAKPAIEKPNADVKPAGAPKTGAE